jgi:hypothetical protein
VVNNVALATVDYPTVGKYAYYPITTADYPTVGKYAYYPITTVDYPTVGKYAYYPITTADYTTVGKYAYYPITTADYTTVGKYAYYPITTAHRHASMNPSWNWNRTVTSVRKLLVLVSSNINQFEYSGSVHALAMNGYQQKIINCSKQCVNE